MPFSVDQLEERVARPSARGLRCTGYRPGSKPWELVRDHRDKALQEHVRKLLKLLSADAQPDQSVNMTPDAPPHGLQEPDLGHRWQELQILTDDELLARADAIFPRPGQKVPKERDPRLPPAGTVLSRRFRNRTHRVLVAAGDFEYAGRRYAHLSSVARGAEPREGGDAVCRSRSGAQPNPDAVGPPGPIVVNAAALGGTPACLCYCSSSRRSFVASGKPGQISRASCRCSLAALLSDWRACTRASR